MKSPMEEIREIADKKVRAEAIATGKKIEQVDFEPHYSSSLKEVVDKYIQQAKDNGVEMDSIWLTDRLDKLCGGQLNEDEKVELIKEWLK